MSNKLRKQSRKQSKTNQTGSNQQKQQFERQEDETIDQCLDRIEQAGYLPVKRIEKPIFKEVIENGEKKLIPDRQRIIFEGIPIKDE